MTSLLTSATDEYEQFNPATDDEDDIDDEDEIKIESEEGYNVVKIHNHGAQITEASCPDKVCIHEGFITKPSESIVCLPNKVHIKIITDDTNNYGEEDIISK